MAGKPITVETSDTVVVSLRAKNPGLFKARFHELIDAPAGKARQRRCIDIA